MKRLLFLLVVGLLQPSAQLADKRPFSLEDLYRLKSIPAIDLSHDGSQIVYALASTDLAHGKQVSHLWRMDLDGNHAQQLTYDEKGETSPTLSPDGKWIAFISPRGGNENVYVMLTGGGEARQLTHVSTGVSDFLWSPDSKALAFSTDVYPECGANEDCNKKISDAWTKGPLKAHAADSLLYRHWTAWKDGRRTHIFLVYTESGAVKDLTPGDFDSPPFQLSGPLQYDFSPDGSELTFVSNHDKVPASSTNNDLWVVSTIHPHLQPQNITAANPGFDGNPRYSPDGRYIAFRKQNKPGYESDLFRLALYDRGTRKVSFLTESFRNWVDEFEWSSDSHSIYFTGPVEGKNPIYRYDLNSKVITQVHSDKTIYQFRLGPKNQLVYVRSAVGEPEEIFRADLGIGGAPSVVRLTRVNEVVEKEVDIRPAEPVWIEGAEGRKIECFLVKPHGFDPQKKYPLILNVHGGPQSQWADSFRGDWQIYPGVGYVLAFCNPHGSTGYGQDFTDAITRDWGGRVFEDLMKVTDALEELPYVDKERMGAMGWSYGGYMMNWFEGHTNRFKAIASMMGIYDLRSFYGATEELWFPEHDLNGPPWDSAEYEKWSPSNYVKEFKTPCLVISGERDYRVPYTQALQFFTALQKMEVPSRLIIYSDAGHWPSWYEMALYYTAHLEWFHQYLGGGAPRWTSQQFLRNEVFDWKAGKQEAKDQKP